CRGRADGLRAERRPAGAERPGARLARRALSARPRLGGAGRPLGRALGARLARRRRRGARLRRGGAPARGARLRALPRPLSRARRGPERRDRAERLRVRRRRRRRDRRPVAAAASHGQRRLAGDAAPARRDGGGGARRRAAGARAGHRPRADARAVRQADRRLPGRLAPAREHVRRRRAHALARLLGGVVRGRGGRAGAGRRGGGEGLRGRGGGRRLRALDPGARRHGLHVGAPAPPLLQAGALARGLRRAPGGAAPRRRRRRARRHRSRLTEEAAVDGQMMDFPLTLTHILRRAETYLGRGEIVTRLPDRSFHRTTYAEPMRRAKQLAVALQQLGLEPGDRVGTLCWNHVRHHEAYFGIPCGGFVLHTLNLRLHPNDLAYIANHGGDRAVIVDRSLVPLLEQFRDRTQIEHVFVVEDSYEELLAGASADDWTEPELHENDAAAMCYTSGTTGLPKGVCYSHRSTVLHALGVASNNPFGLGTSVNDAILPVVPMFHANAWGYPYVATMVGSKLVYPGPHLDAVSLLEDFTQEGVTWSAGVPTIWLGILAELDANPGKWDLSRMKGMFVGGS